MFVKNSHWALMAVSIFFGQLAHGESPALLKTSELRDFETLEEPRKKLIEAALLAASEVTGMPYRFGGNGAKDGGFDCSGSMYYVLNKIGLNPPRTSYGQFLWVQKDSILHPVSTEAKDLTHSSFDKLKPGDLVFWSGTYVPTDNRLSNITHVGMFLGYEKKDGHAVMINASNGRSYRGKKQNGFGVNDFRLPRAGGTSVMVGYGTPPKLE
jgi:peptidoglycan DL-endopeptidase CwlO